MDEVDSMPSGDDRPLLETAAANLAAWHDSSIRALGFETARGSWWWTAPTPAPWIYFTAISLRPPVSTAEKTAFERELARHLDDPAGSFEAVCETFGTVDLGTMVSADPGLRHRSTGLWYARPPGPVELPATGGLEIVEVDDVDLLGAYERASGQAFRAPPPIAPFDVHAPAILDDPSMHVLVGRIDGEVVAGAMAYDSAGVLGVYGVGTVPGHRDRGHATALTLRALSIAPHLTATLQPSAEAMHLYLRLGFAEIGRFTHWG